MVEKDFERNPRNGNVEYRIPVFQAVCKAVF